MQHRVVCALPPPSNPTGLAKGFSLLEWTNQVLPQGQLVSGVKEGWKMAWMAMMRELAPQSKDGAYTRPTYAFGGRLGEAEFPAEAGRYHLYLGNACPWCHRVALAAVLRGWFRPQQQQQQQQQLGPAAAAAAAVAGRQLGPAAAAAAAVAAAAGPQPLMSYTRLEDDPTRARRGGWVFGAADPDPVFGAADLWQVYDTVSPGFRGRCTAPLLVDRSKRAAVCNESADIVRGLDAANLPGATTAVQLRPPALAAQIDVLNARIYSAINNGVYRSGFATTQAAYDAVQAELWGALDEMEGRLSASRFLLGDKLTECDVWLFPTIVRLDAMYGPLFKCSRRRIFGCSSPAAARPAAAGTAVARGHGAAAAAVAAAAVGCGGDYPHLAGWARDIWQLQVPGSLVQISDTLDLDAARRSYFSSLFPLNPGGIVPAGPTAADLQLGSRAPGRGGSSVLEEVCHLRRAAE
ncbi:hypothetical protein CHLRE_14g611517v5 [Chlamydomonas reinhardtii]|uniref:GST C-terminal domain-containing protein n=1 Tax=Chlamydomonas reinhardtii TaxID=3055 RepID=A0A2K3CX98_CHLRE|nr:uncharacterized protein CHLRE_14g611517v5 [Chlamydomonas reinhardtii]PNW72916.1 hypothetical protein CHLRE_14g611517v5 [Chlamydomonas reinhardtii]